MKADVHILVFENSDVKDRFTRNSGHRADRIVNDRN
jgi:hypothetical protein